MNPCTGTWVEVFVGVGESSESVGDIVFVIFVWVGKLVMSSSAKGVNDAEVVL